MEIQELLKRRAELAEESDAATAIAAGLSAQLRDLDTEIVDALSQAEIDSIRHGGRTYFLRQDSYPKVLDRAAALEYFTAAGLHTLLSINAQTLRAWVKENCTPGANGYTLPPGLEGLVDAQIHYKLGVRKS